MILKKTALLISVSALAISMLLAFCVAHPAVSITIPGARNAAQMRENAAGADVEIPRADLDRIAELWRRDFAQLSSSGLAGAISWKK